MNHYQQQKPQRMGIGRFLIASFVVLCGMSLFCVYGNGVQIGNERTTWEATPAATTRLAHAIVEMDLAPELDEATLAAVTQAVLERARQGDVEAAAFVFELAAMQKAPSQTIELEPLDEETKNRLASVENN